MVISQPSGEDTGGFGVGQRMKPGDRISLATQPSAQPRRRLATDSERVTRKRNPSTNAQSHSK